MKTYLFWGKIRNGNSYRYRKDSREQILEILVEFLCLQSINQALQIQD